ncbi:MAG TPA: molybdopterin dinucleotide binding domain-containing protein [Candidatus Lokiarchaeia archaeon]|nr:molybdopterin dinucleotide binding domain-containing protein [Candidatus Lokiarchaeia archaeon]
MPTISVRMTTGGTTDQGVSTKGGRKERTTYTRACAILFLDPTDLNQLQIYPNSPVKVTSAFGEVIAMADLSPDAPHPGLAFMPRGPWTNILVNPDTGSNGTPMYKNTNIEVEPVDNNIKPMDMPEFMRKNYIEKFWQGSL